MASTALTTPTVTPPQSPYHIDVDQALRASQALLRHVKAEARRLRQSAPKKDLLDARSSDSETEENSGDGIPIWLTLTTKHHIVDKNRLLPSKVPVPHALNKSENLSICLIVADPQRAVKNLVTDPSFPTSLSSQINKIIGYTKLKARYKTFESRRQLLSEYDLFLADDRIVTRLPETLGKVFYKGTAKRPIPIRIAFQNRQEGKIVKSASAKRSKEQKLAVFAPANVVAKEIEQTLRTVPVSLKPGTLVAVRIGKVGFKSQQLAENIIAVANAVIHKHVAKGWRNVKAIHIKSPNSAAMPIWLADELWVQDDAVIHPDSQEGSQDLIAGEKATIKRKRNPNTTRGPQAGVRKRVRIEDSDEAKHTVSRNTAEAIEEADMRTKRKASIENQKRRAFDMQTPLLSTKET